MNLLENATLVDHFLHIPVFRCNHNKKTSNSHYEIFYNISNSCDFLSIVEATNLRRDSR